MFKISALKNLNKMTSHRYHINISNCIKTILFSSIFILPVCSFSQTFHAIIFVNTNDDDLKVSTAKNAENIVNLFNEIASELKYTLKLDTFKGDNYNFEKLDSVLMNLTIAKDDIVFFYINNHGYRSSNGSVFPRISIPHKSSTKKYLVSADTINERLVSNCKDAYSVVTMIQACNKKTSSKIDLTLSVNNFTDMSSINYKSLFLSRLNIIMTSSQPGKTSIATTDGSHFTISFIKAITEITDQNDNGTLNWDMVMKLATKYSESLNRRRHPVYQLKNL